MKSSNEIAFEEARGELDFQNQLYTEAKTAGTFAVTAGALVAGFLGRDASAVHGILFWFGVGDSPR